jgi:autotransporter-associated beta strand protein
LDVSATTSGASVSTLSGAGAVTLGAQNLTLSNASSTFSGVIGGTGGMTLAGGTQTLSGSNTYSGSTNLNGGTLRVSADNNMGATSGALRFNGGALETTATFSTARSVSVNSGGATFNTAPSTTMTLNGPVTGAGALTKTGLGTLKQTGVATLSNGTYVRQGELLANGSLNSNVTVDDIGKLAGSGVINGAVNVSGKLAPGNSPGMLTVTSTVTMLSGSTFQENIAGTVQASATTPIGAFGYYSYLRATGNSQFVIGPNAALVPMMKNIFTTTEAGYTSPAFVPSIGQNFRIVTADGGVTGRFSTLTQPDGMATGTRMAVFYNVFESKSIDLRALPSSYALWLSASNENTRSAARALDQILNVDQAGNATTAQDQLMYVTAGQNATDLPGFVRGLAGEVHGALAAVQPQAGQWLQGSVARHLAKAGASAAVVEGTENVGNLNLENGFWVDIGNSKANWNGDGISTGFTSDRTQFSFGADFLREKGGHLGIGLSHSNTNVSADKGAGSVGESMGFIYGQIGYDNYWIDGLIGYGSGKTESQRSNPTGLSGVLRSTHDNNNSLVSLGVRTSFEVDGNIFEPFARVMWQQNTRGGFSEGSAVAALSFASHTSNGMRTLLGLSGNSKINDPLATTNTYQFGIALGQDSGDLTHPSTQASLAGMNTIISAPSMGRTFVQANGSFTGRIDRHAYAYAGISGESHTGKSDLGVNFGVRVKF